MNKSVAKVLVRISIAFAFLIAAFLLAACGGKPAPGPAAPSPAPVTPPPTAAPAPSTVDPAALRAKGELIYQKTAGGVGCQSCHGADGRGTNLGPAIREASADDIKRSLGGDAMSFIRLAEEDIQAVAAYLKSIR